ARSEKDEVARKTALDKLVILVTPDDEGLAREVAPLLKDEDPETARLAAFVLANMGGREAEKALPVLREALRDPDPGTQALAAASLASLGKAAAPAAGDLAKVLAQSKDPVVVRNCALAFAQMGPDAARAVPELGKARRPPVPAAARVFIAEALARMKYPANAEAIPALLEAIKTDPDPTVRQRCIWALFPSGTNEVVMKLRRDIERHGGVAI